MWHAVFRLYQRRGMVVMGKKTLAEFKAFITRGNVLDMAIGVIMGTAFGKIVTSIVNDILMPMIGLILGGLNFSALSLQIKDASIAYGAFIQNVIDFLIVALCLFLMIKFVSKLTAKKRAAEEAEKAAKKAAEEEAAAAKAAEKSAEVLLLEEIRDLMKKEA